MSRRKPEGRPDGERHELVRLIQLLVAEGQRIGHAFAQQQGVNGTDIEALIRILVATDDQPMTAGRLASELGLSTGAVTTLIDRLERDGHVRRVRDTVDRRRVIIHYDQTGLEFAGRFFQPLGVHHTAATADFTPEELAIVKRYLTATIEAFRTYREQLS
ncbi:MarR family winged helix-turn-helix transcriptional regulator [Kribbella sp. HUAS MG21]|uniref:MarR family winged helix-turn-helix transcriptional regulator n=1 Tax=Kribbella sp. HUAS MG21 TaxID=3160966 RepID=A0AAU7TGZ6_9ACTN